MVAAQVMGNHVTVTIAGSHGQLDMNAFKPLMAGNVLRSIGLLSDSMRSFSSNCVVGIEANKDHLSAMVNQSLML
jgi:fumarate hydratase class II